MFRSAIYFTAILSGIFLIFSSCNKKEFVSQRNLDFEQQWRFLEDSIEGAHKADFIDRQWKLVDLPHDWSMEDFGVQDEHLSFYRGKALIIVRSTGEEGLISVSLDAGNLKSQKVHIHAN